MPDALVVKAGILDGGVLEKLTPRLEAFTSSKPSWVKNVDGTERFHHAFGAASS